MILYRQISGEREIPMEYINAFSLNADKDDASFDCDVLISRKIDGELAQRKKELDVRFGEQTSRLLKGVATGALLPLLPILAGFVLLAVAVVLFDSNIALTILLGVIGAICLVWGFYNNKKKANNDSDPYSKDPEYKKFSDDLDKLYEDCRVAMNVPESSPEIDVFTYMYTQKDGKTCNFISEGVFVNEVMQVFRENDSLCFFINECVWSVPFDKIEKIVKIDEDIMFSGWNKEIPFDRGNYMQYKIQELDDDYGHFKMNGYYTIRFTAFDTPYEIIIPSYEIDTVLSISGLKVND